jgi:siroheme synthase
MGLSCLAEIAVGLIEQGLPTTTPVAVIANGTTDRQQEITGILADIAGRVARRPLPSPALLIIGDVVAARGRLTLPGSEAGRTLKVFSAMPAAALARRSSSSTGC